MLAKMAGVGKPRPQTTLGKGMPGAALEVPLKGEGLRSGGKCDVTLQSPRPDLAVCGELPALWSRMRLQRSSVKPM